MTSGSSRFLVCLCAGLIVLSGALAWGQKEDAETAEVGVEADVGIYSAYVIRGQVINDETVVQPMLTASKGGFFVNVWGNYNTTDRVTDRADFSEIDITLEYGRSVGCLEVNGGIIEYVFPNSRIVWEEESAPGVVTIQRDTAPGTREAFLGVRAPEAFVVPTLCAFYDFDEAEGWYIVASLEKDVSLGDALTLTPAVAAAWATAGYNEFCFGVDQDGWNDATAGVTAEYAVSDAVTLTANATYMWLLDKDIEDGAELTYFDTKSFYGGAGARYTF